MLEGGAFFPSLFGHTLSLLCHSIGAINSHSIERKAETFVRAAWQAKVEVARRRAPPKRPPAERGAAEGRQARPALGLELASKQAAKARASAHFRSH